MIRTQRQARIVGWTALGAWAIFSPIYFVWFGQTFGWDTSVETYDPPWYWEVLSIPATLSTGFVALGLIGLALFVIFGVIVQWYENLPRGSK